MAILAYPFCLVYLIFFLFFAKIATIILVISAILLWLYVFYINKFLKFKDDDFSEEEKKLLYKYPIYFRFYFGSITISSMLTVLQMSTIIMAIILLWKHYWLYLIPIAIVFILCANLRPKLDPLFFLKELCSRESDIYRQVEIEKDIELMVNVYEKFWKKRKE